MMEEDKDTLVRNCKTCINKFYAMKGVQKEMDANIFIILLKYIE
jgi:hypothetical protein